MTDMVLAIVVLFHIGIIAIELGYAFQNRICPTAQPRFVLRIFVTDPILISDFRTAREGVRDRSVRTAAALGESPSPIHVLARSNPVPAAGKGQLCARVIEKSLR